MYYKIEILIHQIARKSVKWDEYTHYIIFRICTFLCRVEFILHRFSIFLIFEFRNLSEFTLSIYIYKPTKTLLITMDNKYIDIQMKIKLL